jgi:hypothetical protein
MQLKVNKYYKDTMLEWIPYNQFDKIKEIGKNGSDTIYLAILKDSPLFYNKQYYNHTRDSKKEVALKCLHDSQNITEFAIKEV